jgi:hypothetical protein
MTEIDMDVVDEVLKDMFRAVEGEELQNAIASAACLITELISSQTDSKDEALLLLNTAILTISMNIEQRMKRGDCSWQHVRH